MNHDSAADVERRIANRNGGINTRSGLSRPTERPSPSPVRWLVYLALALAAAWVVMYAVPAFGGLLAATAVGVGLLITVPWAAVTAGARVAARIE